ncbi:MAG: ribonuclease P protein component [Candidatus Omnitrophota bacterium]
MMKKEYRIKKSLDFRKAYKEGRRFSSPHFILYVRRNRLPYARVGVSIAKAHFKLATRRNKLRRVVKELFRKGITAERCGYDFVVASRAGCRDSDIKQVMRELEGLISKPKR